MSFQRSLSCFGRCVAVASLFVATQALAGYVYQFSESSQSASDQGSQGQILIEGSQIKVSGMGGQQSEMVYDGSQNVMTVIDHGRRSFMQLDKATIDQMSQQINSAMAQMQQQLANMPPAQRQMMEKMMKGNMPQAPEPRPELTLTRTGNTDMIAGYKAEKVEVSGEAGLERELWVAPWNSIQGSSEIADAMKGMSSLFDDMLSALTQIPMGGMIKSQLPSNWLDQLQKLEGFPIKTVEYNENGYVSRESTLLGIEERSIAASEFQPPKGYKRQKMER